MTFCNHLNDNGSGDACNSYAITVSVEDDDTGSGITSTVVTVFNNFDPLLANLTNISPDCGHAFMDVDAVTIVATFTDFGLLHTHTLSIHWGDGITTIGSVV